MNCKHLQYIFERLLLVLFIKNFPTCIFEMKKLIKHFQQISLSNDFLIFFSLHFSLCTQKHHCKQQMKFLIHNNRPGHNKLHFCSHHMMLNFLCFLSHSFSRAFVRILCVCCPRKIRRKYQPTMRSKASQV